VKLGTGRHLPSPKAQMFGEAFVSKYSRSDSLKEMSSILQYITYDMLSNQYAIIND
jgi:hypothetical protein